MIKELFRRGAFFILNAKSDLKTVIGGSQCFSLARARARDRTKLERARSSR